MNLATLKRAMASQRAKLGLTALVVVAALLTLVLIVRPVDNKTDKIQPDWSRGAYIGMSVWSQPPALCVSPDARRVHVVWPGRSDDSHAGVRYVQLDEKARRVTEQWLTGLQGAPLWVQVLLDEQARPHVFVIGRLPGEELTRLVHWRLEADGRSPTPLQILSVGDGAVQDYVALPRADGGFDVFWALDPEQETRGVYYVTLDADGQVNSDIRRLNDRPAVQLSAQVDRKGGLHLVWEEMIRSEMWQVYYTLVEDGRLQFPEGVTVAQTDAHTTVGLDGERVYVLWGKEIKRGLYAGMGFTTFVSFPIGHPDQAAQESLYIVEEGRPDYLPYQGEYAFKTLASAQPRGLSQASNFLHSPTPLLGQHDTLAIAAIAGLPFGLNDQIVPAMVLLKEGRPVGYHVIGHNLGFNTEPAMAVDKTGHLYALWLTGSTGAGFRIYYAATTPQARASLDGADLTDILVGIVVLVWRMVGGLSLLPFAPLILMPALTILVIYVVVGGNEALYTRESYGIMIFACLVYWLTKELLLGSVLAELPIGQYWPGWERALLMWAIQLVIAAIAGGVTWRQVSKQRTDSIFWTALIFIGCDIVLTMLIAGPNLAVRG